MALLLAAVCQGLLLDVGMRSSSSINYQILHWAKSSSCICSAEGVAGGAKCWPARVIGCLLTALTNNARLFMLNADGDIVGRLSDGDSDDEDILQTDTSSQHRTRWAAGAPVQQQQEQHMYHQHGAHQHGHHQLRHQQHELSDDEVDSPWAANASVDAQAGPSHRRLRAPLPAPTPELQTFCSEQLPRVLNSVALAVRSSLRRTRSDAAGGPYGRATASSSGQQGEQDEEQGEEVDSRPLHDQRMRRSRRAAAAAVASGPAAAGNAGGDREMCMDVVQQRDCADKEVPAGRRRHQALHRYSTRAAVRARGQ